LLTVRLAVRNTRIWLLILLLRVLLWRLLIRLLRVLLLPRLLGLLLPALLGLRLWLPGLRRGLGLLRPRLTLGLLGWLRWLLP